MKKSQGNGWFIFALVLALYAIAMIFVALSAFTSETFTIPGYEESAAPGFLFLIFDALLWWAAIAALNKGSKQSKLPKEKRLHSQEQPSETAEKLEASEVSDDDPFAEIAAAARSAAQAVEELTEALEARNARSGRVIRNVNNGPSNRCDGDCANCPPHYGYRYGRWYYGHGHTRGCQRGGPGGDSRRTYRD